MEGMGGVRWGKAEFMQPGPSGRNSLDSHGTGMGAGACASFGGGSKSLGSCMSERSTEGAGTRGVLQYFYPGADVQAQAWGQPGVSLGGRIPGRVCTALAPSLSPFPAPAPPRLARPRPPFVSRSLSPFPTRPPSSFLQP
jgi:hypothetical protein